MPMEKPVATETDGNEFDDTVTYDPSILRRIEIRHLAHDDVECSYHLIVWPEGRSQHLQLRRPVTPSNQRTNRQAKGIYPERVFSLPAIEPFFRGLVKRNRFRDSKRWGWRLEAHWCPKNHKEYELDDSEDLIVQSKTYYLSAPAVTAA